MPSSIERTLTDTLDFSDDLSIDPWVIGALLETISFVDSYPYSFHLKTVMMSDVLTFTEGVSPAHDLFLADYFALTEHYQQGQSLTLTDLLDLSEFYFSQKANPLREQLELTDQFTYHVTRSVMLGDNLSLRDAFIGSVFDFRVVNAPTIVKSTIVLDGLILPAPDYGDKDSYESEAVIRGPRKSGIVEVVLDEDWLPSRQLSFTFGHLRRPEMEALRNKLVQIAGRTVSMTDHYSRNWQVMILNPNAEFVQDGRFTWSVELDILCVS